MALTNRNGHKDILSVRNTTMLLRERVKRLVGKGIHVCWQSLPAVKSSGLLDTLTEKQIALEERKFCLITCEVVYNTELAELICLSKQSVSGTDHMSKFNRRTAITAIERVKCCSDLFLDAFEKHWNMTPAVNLTVLNNILQDLAPQFQHYINYCTHQEDLTTVLRIAMKSRRKVAAASFSDRLNPGSVMLPLQHLKLYCLLLKDIHSMLVPTTNHLDTFHCNRMLVDITKLFDECYKLLEKLHGSQYIENIDRILDKSVQGFVRELRQNTISKHQESVSVDPKIFCGKEATDSVHDTDRVTSEVHTLPDVNKHKSPSVKEQCKYFDHQTVEKNFRDVVKCGDKRNTLKRQDYVQVGRKKAVGCTSKHRASQFILKKCAIFEGGEPHNLSKRQNCYTISGHSASHYTNNIRRKRSLSMYDTVHRSLGNNGSGGEKHIGCSGKKWNISVDNNKQPSPRLCSSSSSSSNSSNNSNNNIINNQNNKTPKSTSPFITDLCQFRLSKLSRNSTNTGIESVHESDKVEKHEVFNKLQSSIIQNQTIPSSVLPNNHCQKVLDKCDTVKQLGARLITPTAAVSSPFKVQYKTTRTCSLGDDCDANGLQTESGSCIYKVKIEVQCPPPNEEEKLSEVGSSLSNQHYADGSSSGDGLNSVSKEISYTEELSIDIGNTEESPDDEQQIFVSSGDPNCTSTAHLPSQEESVVSDDFYSGYKPMNESFRRNCYQFKPITPSELLHKNVSAADDCGNEYEEFQPCYTNNVTAGISNSSMLAACDFPLYQLYDFERVKHSGSKAEDPEYINPDEHVYEEVIFHTKLQPEHKGRRPSVPRLEISPPLVNSQQLRWVDIEEVVTSGLLDEMDAEQIALQEAKYEIISSESSYYKSLLILQTVFITSKELTDTAVLSDEDHMTLFSSAMKGKQCSEKFLSALLDGWPEDLKLNYLCHAVSKFVSSGSLQVYVDCCGSHIFIEKTLQHLLLTNSEFADALSMLQADPACEMFSLQSFLILPLQRVTRLPMLVQAILKRLPSDHAEHGVWTDTLVQLQKITEECNEAVGRAETVAAQHFNDHAIQKKNLALNHLPQGRMKKQTGMWKIFGRGRQKIV